MFSNFIQGKFRSIFIYRQIFQLLPVFPFHYSAKFNYCQIKLWDSNPQFWKMIDQMVVVGLSRYILPSTLRQA